MTHTEKNCNSERKIIIEMIEASMEPSEKSGKHPSKPGCNSIVCVNKRKELLNLKNSDRKWEFYL
ncbi:hypothetical protein [Desulfonema magnum]|uniref:Uncharacterized protein n=1 Tax=Desulfonema magnum TaxID=45655 RepID=A0A975BRN8_9BACT|nr:hypothetical protein [Desulfonema magnum]QTA90604.1 Uncharacterized protein dnm_066650 [Desulfonema magnum]